MKKLFKKSLFLIASISTSACFASETDARMIFTNTIGSALNFKSYSLIEDIGVALPSFTQNGRKDLISSLERTGIIRESINNNGSLETSIPTGGLSSTKMIGRDGLDQYRFSGTITIQWKRCVSKTCVPVGEPSNAKINGSVTPAQVNGRPTYKVDSISLE